MKKELFLLSFVLLILLSAQIISAQAEFFEDKKEQFEDFKENATDTKDRLSNESYLATEWREYLRQKKGGELILDISDFLKNFNPIFKVVLGAEYSLSLNFIISIILWAILFILTFGPLDAIFGRKWMSIIGTLVTTSLIGLSGAIKTATDEVISIITDPYIIWWVLLFMILALIIVVYLARDINRYIKSKKEEVEEEETKKAGELLRARAEGYRKGTTSKRKGIDWMTKDIAGED